MACLRYSSVLLSTIAGAMLVLGVGLGVDGPTCLCVIVLVLDVGLGVEGATLPTGLGFEGVEGV